MIIDLSNSSRYYSQMEVPQGVTYVKVTGRGGAAARAAASRGAIGVGVRGSPLAGVGGGDPTPRLCQTSLAPGARRQWGAPPRAAAPPPTRARARAPAPPSQVPCVGRDASPDPLAVNQFCWEVNKALMSYPDTYFLVCVWGVWAAWGGVCMGAGCAWGGLRMGGCCMGCLHGGGVAALGGRRMGGQWAPRGAGWVPWGRTRSTSLTLPPVPPPCPHPPKGPLHPRLQPHRLHGRVRHDAPPGRHGHVRGARRAAVRAAAGAGDLQERVHTGPVQVGGGFGGCVASFAGAGAFGWGVGLGWRWPSRIWGGSCSIEGLDWGQHFSYATPLHAANPLNKPPTHVTGPPCY